MAAARVEVRFAAVVKGTADVPFHGVSRESVGELASASPVARLLVPSTGIEPVSES